MVLLAALGPEGGSGASCLSPSPSPSPPRDAQKVHGTQHASRLLAGAGVAREGRFQFLRALRAPMSPPLRTRPEKGTPSRLGRTGLLVLHPERAGLGSGRHPGRTEVRRWPWRGFPGPQRAPGAAAQVLRPCVGAESAAPPGCAQAPAWATDPWLAQLGTVCHLGLEDGASCFTGLLVACYHGFVDAVVALAECPHVDVNWQDNEGNTALIMAAQAGHATITNYLLNYFPGLDLERRNAFGFTALMKAAMQGRSECIRALMLAGADVHARDPCRGMSAQEWAAYTGRVEAVRVMQRLLERPCPEQFGDKYRPELPALPEAARKPAGSRNCWQRLCEFLRCALSPRASPGLEDGGVLDHMVRMTTSLYSPAVAVVCQTVCPENPPCVGRRRLAVQEILAARGHWDAPAPGR
nr:ankyrin repeat domain-containing protein 33B [Cavia porcellus]